MTTFQLALWIASVTPSQAHAAGRRVALVIGNGDHAQEQLRPLDNARSDAERMAQLLDAHGFELIGCGGAPDCLDATSAELDTALKRLRARAKRAALAFVYYAGRGMDPPGQDNVSLPDTAPHQQTCTLEGAHTVEQVVDAAWLARSAVVVVDAGRSDPFLQCGRAGQRTGDVSFADLGLEGTARGSLLLVSSTQPGQTASDGMGREHSPFAETLLGELNTWPHLHFQPLFDRVAVQLIQQTGGHRDDVIQVLKRPSGGASPLGCLAGHDCVADPEAERIRQRLDELETQHVDSHQLVLVGLQRMGRSPGSLLSRAEQRQLEAFLGVGRVLDARGEDGRSARSALSLGDDEQARDLFLADLEPLEREHTAISARMAEIYRHLAALERHADTTTCARYRRQAAELDPKPFWDWSELVTLYLRMSQTREAQLAADQAMRTAESRREQSVALINLGDVARARGKPKIAKTYYTAGLRFTRQLAQQLGTPDALRDLAVSLDKLGDMSLTQSDLEAAEAYYTEELELARQLAQQLDTPETLRNLSLSLFQLGSVARRRSDLETAAAHYAEGLEFARQLAQRLDTPDVLGDLALACHQMGDVRGALGDTDGQRTLFVEVVQLFEHVARIRGSALDKGWVDWAHQQLEALE